MSVRKFGYFDDRDIFDEYLQDSNCVSFARLARPSESLRDHRKASIEKSWRSFDFSKIMSVVGKKLNFPGKRRTGDDNENV